MECWRRNAAVSDLLSGKTTVICVKVNVRVVLTWMKSQEVTRARLLY